MDNFNKVVHEWEFDMSAYRIWFQNTNWFWFVSMNSVHCNPDLSSVHKEAWQRLRAPCLQAVEFCLDYSAQPSEIAAIFLQIHLHLEQGGVAVVSIEDCMDPNFNSSNYYAIPYK